jgi:hypothetical protein
MSSAQPDAAGLPSRAPNVRTGTGLPFCKNVPEMDVEVVRPSTAARSTSSLHVCAPGYRVFSGPFAEDTHGVLVVSELLRLELAPRIAR